MSYRRRNDLHDPNSSTSAEALFRDAKTKSYAEVKLLCQNNYRFRTLLCQPDSDLNIWRYMYDRDISRRSLPEGTDYFNVYDSIVRHIRHLFLDEAIHYATRNGYEILAENLSQFSQEKNLVPLSVDQPGNYEDLIRKLARYEVDDRENLLASAAMRGDTEVMERMLQLGATDYNYAMTNAAHGGQMAVIERMLQLGADDYASVLDVAASQNNAELVELMLQFDISTPDIDVALHNAVESASIDVVEILLQHSPSVSGISLALGTA